MARKRKSQRREDSSSSDGSPSNDEMSSAPTTPIRTSESLAATENRRNRRIREDKGIKRMLKDLKEDISKMRKQLKIHSTETKDENREIRKELKKLTESQNELLRKYLVHNNGSSGDDSAAPRSESNQVQPPRYRLEFKCQVKNELEKGQIIMTTNHGNAITVALLDDHNQIVKTEPLASAKVKLVVIDGEFNQHDNQYDWLRKDFERSIKRPPQKNSAMRDVNQQTESIVSNCVFKLDGGFKSHTGSTILCNSSNRKVRLGVMLLSPAGERVLEGLSNPFFVRGHDRIRQKQALVRYDCQERNGPKLNKENTSLPILTKPGEINPNVSSSFPGSDTVAEPNTTLLPTESSISPETAAMLQQLYPQRTTYGWAGMAQDQNVSSSFPGSDTVAEPNTTVLPIESPISPETAAMLQQLYPQRTTYGWAGMAQATESLPGTQINMQLRPVQLVWDRPNVELRKSWNLLDKLMPLHSGPPKFYNSGLPTVHLTTEYIGSPTSTLKDVMQTTRRNKGVVIEPLEPDDDSDEELPLKRKLHSKYRLRFLNKVCEAYYTWEEIDASNGDDLKVALFDEHNMRIISGPLSTASVEVVVLHGDFNVDGQHYWTSEEFSACIVCSKAGKEEPVLAGNRVLALANGKACLRDAFFQITSCHARTGKFKMGVVLASAQDERVQEGISGPFLVRERRWKDKELIRHYLGNRIAAVPYPIHVIPEVESYNFNPWELPGKAAHADREWYFFSPWDQNGIYRAAGSGYWKSTGIDKPIHDTATGESIGIKKTLVFYRDRASAAMTSWTVHEYRIGNKMEDWVLCRIFFKKTVKDGHSVIVTPGCTGPVRRRSIPEGRKVSSPVDGEAAAGKDSSRAGNESSLAPRARTVLAAKTGQSGLSPCKRAAPDSEILEGRGEHKKLGPANPRF